MEVGNVDDGKGVGKSVDILAFETNLDCCCFGTKTIGTSGRFIGPNVGTGIGAGNICVVALVTGCSGGLGVLMGVAACGSR